MHEFDLIQKYFSWDELPENVLMGVGDDAAVLEIAADEQLVTSIDTFISGVHFPHDTPAEAIGHKALAVNLSDLAAMGASPQWFTLALTLPEIRQNWLADFSRGLKTLAQESACFLVGGDTTRGALSISIQVMGVVKKGQALTRSGARAGDLIYLTGTLGDAHAGLESILHGFELAAGDKAYCQKRLHRPTPRLQQSELIRPFATACIDLSDGFLQDLGHLLSASRCGAQINTAELPLSKALQTLPQDIAMQFALSGGDDYELLFTIPKNKQPEFEKYIKKGGDGLIKQVGVITHHTDQIIDENKQLLDQAGYSHF